MAINRAQAIQDIALLLKGIQRIELSIKHPTPSSPSIQVNASDPKQVVLYYKMLVLELCLSLYEAEQVLPTIDELEKLLAASYTSPDDVPTDFNKDIAEALKVYKDLLANPTILITSKSHELLSLSTILFKNFFNQENSFSKELKENHAAWVGNFQKTQKILPPFVIEAKKTIQAFTPYELSQLFIDIWDKNKDKNGLISDLNRLYDKVPREWGEENLAKLCLAIGENLPTPQEVIQTIDREMLHHYTGPGAAGFNALHKNKLKEIESLYTKVYQKSFVLVTGKDDASRLYNIRVLCKAYLTHLANDDSPEANKKRGYVKGILVIVNGPEKADEKIIKLQKKFTTDLTSLSSLSTVRNSFAGLRDMIYKFLSFIGYMAPNLCCATWKIIKSGNSHFAGMQEAIQTEVNSSQAVQVKT